jgi:hypothetical protein
MKVLNQFGEASGGRAWEIAEASFGKNMDAVLDTIAAELRRQYSIGYYPTHPKKDGKWHSVRIRMKNPDYLARGRKEYLDREPSTVGTRRGDWRPLRCVTTSAACNSSRSRKTPL